MRWPKLPDHKKPYVSKDMFLFEYKNIRSETIGYTGLKIKKDGSGPAYAKPFFTIHEHKFLEAWPLHLPMYGMEQGRNLIPVIVDNEYETLFAKNLYPKNSIVSFPGGKKYLSRVDLSFLGWFPTIVNAIKNPELYIAFECHLANQKVRHHSKRILMQSTKKGEYRAIATLANKTFGIYLNSGDYVYAEISEEVKGG